MTTKDLIPIKDAPKCLPFAEKTLRNWRSQGLYPKLFVKLGGKVFINLAEFEKLVERQKNQPNNP